MMLRPAPDEKGLGLASCVLGCRGVAAIAHDAPRQMAASYLSNTLAEQTGEPGLQSGEASRNVYYLFLLRQLKLAARQVQESAFIPAWSGSSTRKAQAHSCPVRKLPVAGGRGVQYRKRHSLVQNIVVVWRKDKREPWFLTTDLNQGANQLCDLYGKRMQIEELFRDYKNRRNGFSLPCTRIRIPEILSRALLILALGYILLLGIGLHAKEHYAPSSWGSSTRADGCSYFIIGQRILDQVQLQIMSKSWQCFGPSVRPSWRRVRNGDGAGNHSWCNPI